jgi:DNA-binding transcriptional MerR regulator
MSGMTMRRNVIPLQQRNMNTCTAPKLQLAGDRESEDSAGTPAGEPAYTISELAKRFGLTLRTLRFYESRGLLTPVRRGRHRLYGQKDVERLAVIVKAKSLGLTLAAIRRIVADEGAGPTLRLSREACLAQIAVLERKLAEIEAALAELRAMAGSADDRRPDRR